MQGFQGKVIAVTGAASGIGLATAQLLFAAGAKLSLSDRSLNTLEQATRALLATHPNRQKEDIMTAEVDVTSSARVTSWIEETVKAFGRLDGAVNSAGISAVQMGKGRIRDLTDDSWALCMGINATGVFYSMRAELNAMTNGGSIVNLASLAGVIAVPCAAEYGASKHAVVGLTKTGAREEGPNGIRVNAVAPGQIDTPMTRSVPQEFTAFLNDKVAKQPISRQGRAEEVAALICFLLSDSSAFITGQIIRIDGGSSV
ncbi:D-arabinitol 2-dehydrogenase [Fusarium pseudoanthophilum]|uniref:D-arabinitol 2-dehydrogenase n=1 Tax=Fusarium pseudoanthophilum TaxID=48495 RepID=A0A8H5KTB9_9HYPO|nr:D-arabinitol 2-dehydrogenase [Fusarium pseudoanthophilum]